MKPAPVAIQGGSGYGGGELLRLLGSHPDFTVTQVSSRHHAGKPVAAVHRQLHGLCDLVFQEELDLAVLCGGGPAFVVSALPNGQSAAALSALLGGQVAAGVPSASVGGRCQEEPSGGPWPDDLKVVDLSADLRLRDAARHAAAHPQTPAFPELRAAAEYGLVELRRDAIREARLVANPGCFATALELALAPLVAAGLRGFVAADGKTGSSGSGSVPSETAHHPGRHSDFRAYSLGGHAHAAEVTQMFEGSRLRLSFVPHSAPMVRGIFVTLHAPGESFEGRLPDLGFVRQFYREEPMVRVRRDSPRVLDVAGTNFCDVTLARHGDGVVVCAALDNLGKGMAGQAVQNLNVMAGIPETRGLMAPALGPA